MTERGSIHPDRGENSDSSESGFGRLKDPMERLQGTSQNWFPTAAEAKMALDHVQNVAADVAPYLGVLDHTHTEPIVVEGVEGARIDTTYVSGQVEGAHFVGDILRLGESINQSTAQAIGDGLVGAAHLLRDVNAVGGRFDAGRILDLLLLPGGPAVVHQLNPGLTGVIIPIPESRFAGQNLPLLDALVRLGESAVRLRELAPQVGMAVGIELADMVGSLGGRDLGERDLRYFQDLQRKVGQAVARGDDGLFHRLAEEIHIARTDTFVGVVRGVETFSSTAAQLRYMINGSDGGGALFAQSKIPDFMNNAEIFARIDRLANQRREQEIREMLRRGRGDDDNGGGIRPSREPDGPEPRGGPSGRRPEDADKGRDLSRDVGGRAVDLYKHQPGDERHSSGGEQNRSGSQAQAQELDRQPELIPGQQAMVDLVRQAEADAKNAPRVRMKEEKRGAGRFFGKGKTTLVAEIEPETHRALTDPSRMSAAERMHHEQKLRVAEILERAGVNASRAHSIAEGLIGRGGAASGAYRTAVTEREAQLREERGLDREAKEASKEIAQEISVQAEAQVLREVAEGVKEERRQRDTRDREARRARQQETLTRDATNARQIADVIAPQIEAAERAQAQLNERIGRLREREPEISYVRARQLAVEELGLAPDRVRTDGDSGHDGRVRGVDGREGRGR